MPKSSSPFRPLNLSLAAQSQAGAAAVEACERAYGRSFEQQPLPPRPKLRSRRSQGSHFEENRQKSRRAAADSRSRSSLKAPMATTTSAASTAPSAPSMARSRPPTVTAHRKSSLPATNASTAVQSAGSHGQKLRERKSFISSLFEKRSPTKPARDPDLPPFNHANDSDDVFSLSSLAQPESSPVVTIKTTDSRVGSLKNKIKRILSRPKLAPTIVPTQHVDSKTLHYGPVSYTDHSKTCAASSTAGTVRGSSSTDESSTMYSRVTSWADSTVTSTMRSLGPDMTLSSIYEGQVADAIDPASASLRSKSASLLSRTLKVPRRRQSRNDLSRSSEESQKLYKALCKHIGNAPNHEDSGVQLADVDGPPMHQVDEADAQLDDSTTSTIKALRATVPDQPPRAPPQPPIVSRKPSWWSSARSSLPSQSGSRKSSLCSTHKTVTATTPGPDIIMSRVRKSRNRWRASLTDDGTNVKSSLETYANGNVNPYQLSSIPSTTRDSPVPDSARHSSQHTVRSQVVSPSVYSRTSDCRVPFERDDEPEIKVRITGRETKRYHFDSPSKQSAGPSFVTRPNHEWTSWLDEEMADLDLLTTSDTLSLAGAEETGQDAAPSASTGRNLAVPISSPPPPSLPPLPVRAQKRPLPRSGPPAYMNERYPLMTPPTAAKRTRPAEHLSATAAASEVGVSMGTAGDGPTMLPAPMDSARLGIRQRHSTTLLGGGRGRANATGTTAKPKSQGDLAATFRNVQRLGVESKSGWTGGGDLRFNIRQKAHQSPAFMADRTLQKICQGPYATPTEDRADGAADDKENSVPRGARGTRAGGNVSPGRVMAEEFLKTRRRGESEEAGTADAFI